MTELTRSYAGGSGSGLDLIIYGILIMVIALLRPQGLVSLRWHHITGLFRKSQAGGQAP